MQVIKIIGDEESASRLRLIF